MTAKEINMDPNVVHFVDAWSLVYTSGNRNNPRDPSPLKNTPIPKKI
jgi:hypothetical protein